MEITSHGWDWDEWNAEYNRIATWLLSRLYWGFCCPLAGKKAVIHKQGQQGGRQDMVLLLLCRVV